MSGRRITELLLFVILTGALILPVSADTTSSTMVNVGFIPADAFINHIYGNTLYTGEGVGLRAYDISPGRDLSSMNANSFNGQLIYPWYIYGMTTSGNYLYLVGAGGRLQIVDITDRLHPVNAGNINYGYNTFRDINVIGNYAYVAGWGLLEVFDVSNKNNPMHVTGTWLPHINDDIGYSGRITNDGNYLYLASGAVGQTNSQNGGTGFFIYNISTPANPVWVSTATFSNTSDTTGIAYHNNTVYINSFKGNIHAFDITNRSNPVMIWASWSDAAPLPGPVDMQVAGNYLYVSNRYHTDACGGAGGLYIYDISSPIPVRVSTECTNTFYTEQITTNGNITAIATNTFGNNLYDTSNKASPYFISKIATPATSVALTTGTIGSRDVIWAGGRNGGIWMWDITDPLALAAQPRVAAAWNPYPDYSTRSDAGVVQIGNYTYSTMDGNGDGLFSQNWTGYEKLASSQSVPYSWWHGPFYNMQTLFGNSTLKKLFSYGYTGDYNGYSAGVAFYNLSPSKSPDQTHPVLSGFTPYGVDNPYFDYPNHPGYMFGAAGSSGGIAILNISSDSPVPVAYFDTGQGHYYSLKLSHNLGYNTTTNILYAVYSDGAHPHLRQIDMSDINNIHFVEGLGSNGQLDWYGDFGADGVVVNGTDGYVLAGETGSIKHYDFSNPHNFRFVSEIDVPGGVINSALLYKGYLYVFSEGCMGIYHLLPASSIPGISSGPQQTIGSQNQQPPQQSNSSDDIIGQKISQITGFLKKVVNFFLRHFPTHI